MTSNFHCRFCHSPLREPFLDLGTSPLANAYLSAADRFTGERFFPLAVYRCLSCELVQLPNLVSATEIFSDYDYFSSYSDGWLAHARQYVSDILAFKPLGPQSQVIELASNDGYLLQYFVPHGIPVLGIEPAQNVAQAALAKGVPTQASFFNRETAAELVSQHLQADLLIANNVLAHVPDLNDFMTAIALILKPDGLLTAEFPSLLNLLQYNQFDTIYHEHFSYFSLRVMQKILKAHGLKLFHVEELPTHGGSLRIYASLTNQAETPALQSVLEAEKRFGLDTDSPYAHFFERVQQIRLKLLQVLLRLKTSGKNIVAYGAPAKGNTLLNYCKVTPELLPYTVDRSPHKQGKFLPGSHVPILAPDQIRVSRPDYVLILPWNLQSEIMAQLDFIRDWGGQFMTAVPEVRIHSTDSEPRI